MGEATQAGTGGAPTRALSHFFSWISAQCLSLRSSITCRTGSVSRPGITRKPAMRIRWSSLALPPPAAAPSSGLDTAKYGATDFLIVNVGWKPDSRSVVYQVQDREQSWLDLNTADRTTGESRTLFRETSKTWVNCGNVGCQDDNGNPIWLKNGSFLWFSERTGGASSVPVSRKRHGRPSRHHRHLGGPHCPRRGRTERMDLLLRYRT